VNWLPLIQWFVLASAAMLLPRRVAAAFCVAAIVVTSVGQATYDYVKAYSLTQSAIFTCYYAAVLAVGAVALYGSARLVAILADLFAARTELAEQAVSSERLRMSRDLHDLLGQSLSAVSLKGDLALRLLPRDPCAAHREIEGLTSVARSALRDMRAVTHAEHDVSLTAEADSAQAVLEAAGVRTQVDIALPALPAAADSVLAWAVREGATNILRHSQATTASITAGRGAGRVWVQIVNDGADAPGGTGSGLAGLADRAGALGGTAVGEHLGGEFRLRVELPEALGDTP
jgi:two-component system sensor histidine kinase DesK